MASKIEIVSWDLADIAAQIADYMAANPAEYYTITCQAKLKLRTLQMLRYYFGVIVRDVCQFHNNTQNVWWNYMDAHWYLKVKYMIDFGEALDALWWLLLWEIDPFECLLRLRKTFDECTTTDKDVENFKAIMEKIRRDYDKLGCVIKLPNEIPITAYENELC